MLPTKCYLCSDDNQRRIFHNQLIPSESGIQQRTCYDCVKHYCRPCNNLLIIRQQNADFPDDWTTNADGEEIAAVKFCKFCEKITCQICEPVEACSVCNSMFCESCSPSTNLCEGQCRLCNDCTLVCFICTKKGCWCGMNK